MRQFTLLRPLGMAPVLCAASFGLMSLDGHAHGMAQAASDAAVVSVIALERNCFGCAGAGVLELRRDGTATFSVQGNARQGTGSRVARGSVRAQDFDALSRLLVAKGFFSMQDVYQAVGLADGAWTIVAATAGTVHKRVFSREDAGPDGLRAIEAAIDGVHASIVFSSTP